MNRRAGAQWALAEEPGAGHVIGRSRDLAMLFFEDVLLLRVDATSNAESRPLKPLDERAGYLGDPKAKTFVAVAGAPAPTEPTSWLPTERVARVWQAVVTDQPFEKR